jgi:hypothetical protein
MESPRQERSRVDSVRAWPALKGRVPRSSWRWVTERSASPTRTGCTPRPAGRPSSILGLDPSRALAELHHQLLTQTEEAPVRVAPPAAPTWRLPVLLDETIGREEEIATLTRLLVDGHSRLVTVLGAGGVGKSRIAVAVGERAGAATSGRRGFPAPGSS